MKNFKNFLAVAAFPAAMLFVIFGLIIPDLGKSQKKQEVPINWDNVLIEVKITNTEDSSSAFVKYLGQMPDEYTIKILKQK